MAKKRVSLLEGASAGASEEELTAARDEALVKLWVEEIEAADKREKEFRIQGNELVSLYEAGKVTKSSFNILYTNTETLGPAIFNSTPRPVVRRRFNDPDPLGKCAAQAGERILTYLINDGMTSSTNFDELLSEGAVLDALVPGRGVLRFGYDSDIIKVKAEEEAEAAEAAGVEAEGEDSHAELREQTEVPPAAREKVSYECVEAKHVGWDRFRHGFATRWEDVPWVSYEWRMTREELEKNFGALGLKVPLQEAQDNGIDQSTMGADRKVKLGIVHEVWDKENRRVIFLSPDLKEVPLRVVPDPLGLSGFFNCPRPLTFFPKISSLTPTALYQLYKEQAEELNTVSLRITKIVSALKVRGFYDRQVQGMSTLMDSADGTLVPVDNVAALYAQSGGLDKALWLMPIEKLVTVLQQLYMQRDQIRQVIFEIIGLADIMRGASQASETLGAQELKQQWGGLRLKRAQRRLAGYVRDCLRLMLEIAVNKLDPALLKSMTGLPYPLQAEQEQAKMLASQMAEMGQQPPPDIASVLSQPAWETVLGLLRDGLQRRFRIDIETNSTVDAEATQDKADIAELLNAISQFLSGVGPLIEQGVMPFEVAKTMLLAVVRRFRLGTEFEEALQAMKQPPPKPDPAAQKLQADMAAKQADQQFQIQKHQSDMQMEQQRLALEQAKIEKEAALAREEMLAEMALKREQMILELAMEREKMLLELQLEEKRVHLQDEQADRQLASQERVAATTSATEAQTTATKEAGSLTAIQALLQAVGAPKKGGGKRITLKAPSGAVYQGAIEEGE